MIESPPPPRREIVTMQPATSASRRRYRVATAPWPAWSPERSRSPSACSSPALSMSSRRSTLSEASSSTVYRRGSRSWPSSGSAPTTSWRFASGSSSSLAVAAAIVGYLAVRRPMAGVVGIGRVRIRRRARRAAPTGRVRSARAAAADRYSDRHPAARLAPPPDGAERRSTRPARRGCHSAGTAGGSWSPPAPPLLRRSSPVGWHEALERRRVETIRAAIPDSLPPIAAAGSTAHRDPGRRHAQPGDAVHHTEQRLLSDRHRTVVPPRSVCRAGRSTSTGMVDTPLTLDLRRPAGQASGRADRHACAACRTRSAASTSPTPRFKACCWPICCVEAGVQRRRRAGVQHQPRRVDVRISGRGGARRPRCDDRLGNER